MNKNAPILDSMIRSATLAKKSVQGASAELIGGYLFDSFQLHAQQAFDDHTLVARLAGASREVGGTAHVIGMVEADKEITLPKNWDSIKIMLNEHHSAIDSAINKGHRVR